MLALSLMLSLTAIGCGGKDEGKKPGKGENKEVAAAKKVAEGFVKHLEGKKIEEAKKLCKDAKVCEGAKEFEGLKLTLGKGEAKDKKVTFHFTFKKDKKDHKGHIVLEKVEKDYKVTEIKKAK